MRRFFHLFLLALSLLAVNNANAFAPTYTYDKAAFSAWASGWDIPACVAHRTWSTTTVTAAWTEPPPYGDPTAAKWCEFGGARAVYFYQQFPSSDQCPVNATLSGGNCTCNATYTELNGTCQAPPSCPDGTSYFNGACSETDAERCKSSQKTFNSTFGERYVDVEMPGQISSGTSLCIPSSTPAQSGGPLKCSMNFERNISYQDAKGVWQSRGTLDMGGMMGNYSTLPCGESATIPQVQAKNLNPVCPPNQQSGTFNGATVCKPFGPDVTIKTTDKTSTTTNPDGSTSSSTTSTDCKGAGCTTTTSTTNGVGTTSTSSTTTKNDFCVANPASPQCGNAAGGGGADPGGCDAAADTLGCSKFGEPGATTPTPNTDIALTFSRESGFGASNGSCPAPRVMNIPGGQTISMSFDMYCSFASGMRPFIIGFALLSAAGMVVFGATRKG